MANNVKQKTQSVSKVPNKLVKAEEVATVTSSKNKILMTKPKIDEENFIKKISENSANIGKN